jgi:hypothetical protein
MPLSLQEHIIRSRQAVEANKAKGNRYAEFLARLYADPFRFLEEIIQNTEDACARNTSGEGPCMLRFCLFTDRIDILHNGIPFDEHDLMAVTTFAGTTKDRADGINQIGKFGIGFRSVFGVTDQPEIHSAHWHFRIADYEILEETAPVSIPEGFTTLIRLPFRKGKEKEFSVNVRTGLMNIRPYTLLFLEHLKLLEIRIGSRGVIRMERTSTPAGKNMHRRHIISSDANRSDDTFLVLSPQAGISEGKFSLAFRLGKTPDGGEEAIPETLGRIFVYFPTQQQTPLKFLLHGNFTTTSTREQVPFDDEQTPENIRLLEKAAAFLASSLPGLRDAGFIRPSFLDMLPFSSGMYEKGDPVYRMFSSACISAFGNKKLVPVEKGRFEKSVHTAYTADDSIMALAGTKGSEVLFRRAAWLDKDFRNFPEKHPALFSALDIKTVDARSLGFRLSVNPGFIRLQKREWFRRFYAFLLQHPELWDEAHQHEHYSLRSKEIILLNDDRLAAAYDISGTPLLRFVLSGKGIFGRVDRRLMQDSDCVRFFTAFGLLAGAKPNSASDEPEKEGAEGMEKMHVDITSVKPAEAIQSASIQLLDYVAGIPDLHSDMDPGHFASVNSAVLAVTAGVEDDSVRKWYFDLAVLALQHHFKEQTVEKVPIADASAALVVRIKESPCRVFVAVRDRDDIHFRMPAGDWFHIIEDKAAVGSLIVLIHNTFHAGVRIQIVEQPYKALSEGQFIFEASGFRVRGV